MPLQAQAAGHDEGRGQRHGRRGDDRVEEAERGERQRGGVVAERPGEVAADGPEGGAGERDRVGDASEVVAEQDQVRGADRDVGAGPEGQPEVGGGERGGVIDAVADHGDPVPLRLQPGDDGCLIGGQRPCDHLVDADLRGDGPGGRLVVAGQQDGAQAEGAQPGDGGRRGRLDRVGDGDGALDRAVPADQHRGAAGLLPGAALRGQLGRHGHPVPGKQLLPADDDLAAVDGAPRAESGQGPEPVRPRQGPGLRRAAALIAAATACSEACSTAPA